MDKDRKLKEEKVMSKMEEERGANDERNTRNSENEHRRIANDALTLADYGRLTGISLDRMILCQCFSGGLCS